jgi:hypothetical protein
MDKILVSMMVHQVEAVSEKVRFEKSIPSLAFQISSIQNPCIFFE